MDYRKLDPGKYDISEGETLENGTRQIIISYREERRFCEECLSADVVKKCPSTRKVLDVVDKKPVQYAITRYRYRCKGCKRTFIPEDLYDPKVRIAPEFGKFLAQKMLQDNLTEKQATKTYGVSTTYVSEAIHGYEQEFEDKVLAIASCHTLAFYPFVYSNLVRCCVIGTDYYDKNVLVGILPDYASETIAQFIRKKVPDVKDLKFIYCDLNPDVFKRLSSEFPKTKVMILHDRLIYHCCKLNNDTGDGLFNDKSKHIKKFNAIVCSADASSEPLRVALEKWWSETPGSIRSHFLPLWNQIEGCLDGCENSTISNEMKEKISTMLDIIKAFRKNNIQFDIMILKTWFKDDAAIRMVKRTAFGKYMSMRHASDSEPIEYSVNIDKLKKAYLK